MTNARINHMIEGKPALLIFSFALPLMIGNVFQQLYTVADAMIVGKILGVDALAALGSAEWPNWLMLGIIQGLTQGFSIPMTHEYGAGKVECLKRCIGNSVVLSLLFSSLLVGVGQLVARPLLVVLDTPQEILGSSLLYLRTLFLGIPIVLLFNFQAAVLRSLGDGKTPLYALIVASLSNIGLDFLFVLGFRMGVLGAAVATLLAQLISNIYCFMQIRRLEELKVCPEDCKIEPVVIGGLLKHGMPIAFQNALITIGSLVVQFVVNQYGVLFIAGFAATNKLYGVLEIAAISYGYAMITYAGQNLGAQRYDRIRCGYQTALVIAAATSLVISVIILLFGKNILLFFLSGTPSEVERTLHIAYRYLKIMGIFLPILYVLHVTRSTIQGIGNTFLPMMAGIGELIMRITSALVLPAFVGRSGIFYAEIMAWLGADIILLVSFFWIWKKNISR